MMLTQPTLFLDTMNRQQKITISGVVFHVEENCKKKLLDHVSFIRSQHYAISDERLAELLLEQLKVDGSDVVCAKIVEEVIAKAKHLRKPD